MILPFYQIRRSSVSFVDHCYVGHWRFSLCDDALPDINPEYDDKNPC
uniref:Uncharacterized protein n=1 Tax=Methylophaga nitratireducenticrescens TaxID=754476 RepID=I1XG05_METNJ